MRKRVDPTFIPTLKKFGLKEWNSCFHCGNCTAICSLTEDKMLFPRKTIRAAQMGIKENVAASLEPWMCYYCGECSTTCPRDANPGEVMMSIRRWITTKYDWTRLANLFYTSKTALLIAFILVAFSMLAISYYKQFETVAIMEFGHQMEKYLIYGVFSLLLVPNILRMFWLTIIKEKTKAPISSYIKGIWKLFIHMFTQLKFIKCEKNTFRWFEHFLVVTGYLVLLVTTVFLNWFSTNSLFIIYLGYIVGGLVFIFTFDFIISRYRKNKEITKFSHSTDWLFVIWLFLMALTAFIVRILVDLNLITSNLWLYIVHLIVIAQWGILIVPFGKWTHFLYRSFAIGFADIKKAEIQKAS